MNYEVFTILEQEADPVRAKAMSAYMRDQFPFLGIAKPQRAALTRGFLKAVAWSQGLAVFADVDIATEVR